jgi:hypothetical protein
MKYQISEADSPGLVYGFSGTYKIKSEAATIGLGFQGELGPPHLCRFLEGPELYHRQPILSSKARRSCIVRPSFLRRFAHIQHEQSFGCSLKRAIARLSVQQGQSRSS